MGFCQFALLICSLSVHLRTQSALPYEGKGCTTTPEYSYQQRRMQQKLERTVTEIQHYSISPSKFQHKPMLAQQAIHNVLQSITIILLHVQQQMSPQQKSQQTGNNGFPSQLNLLCVGEASIGKSDFLEKYTADSSSSETYKVYIREIQRTPVFFHELAEEESLYLEAEYDGVIFFIDFKHNWKIQGKILKWLQLYSKSCGSNIFKIPIHVVVLNYNRQPIFKKWKQSIEKELSSIIELSQVSFYSIQSLDIGCLNDYIMKIIESKAEGIKFTHYTYWKLYGLTQYLKHFICSVRIFIFRQSQLYEKQKKKHL